MLTADKVKILSTFNTKDIVSVLNRSGYYGVSFKTTEFIGITTGMEFCYRITFYDDMTGNDRIKQSKVFLSYNAETDSVTADY